MKAGVALALGALGLALLTVEAGLRVFPVAAVELHRRAPAESEQARFYEYDPRLGWRGRPHARGRFDGWEFGSEVALNAEGFREREAPGMKAGRFRIVVLGDSISWGYGVEQAERYSDLLRLLLLAWGIRAEVVNLAVSGYATDQEYLLFQADGRRYCPDLVLLGLYANDLHENASTVQGRYPKPYFQTVEGGELAVANVPVPRITDSGVDLREWATEDGSLKSFLRRHLRLYAAAALVKAALSARADRTPAGPAVSPEHIELTARLVRRLAGEVEESGAAFLVVVLPDAQFAAAPAVAAARSGAAHVLDLTPVFRAAALAGPPLFYRLDGAHWTRRGHAVAAAAIAEFLAQVRPFPSTPRTCAAE